MANSPTARARADGFVLTNIPPLVQSEPSWRMVPLWGDWAKSRSESASAGEHAPASARAISSILMISLLLVMRGRSPDPGDRAGPRYVRKAAARPDTVAPRSEFLVSGGEAAELATRPDRGSQTARPDAEPLRNSHDSGLFAPIPPCKVPCLHRVPAQERVGAAEHGMSSRPSRARRGSRAASNAGGAGPASPEGPPAI